MPADIPVPSGNIQYTLDGGALLHRIPWNDGSTYEEIWQQNVTYVDHHYSKPAVVFDGYKSGPITKDSTQQRRAGKHPGAAVQFSRSMVFVGKKTDFLANKENKQRFIDLLSDKLECHGCQTDHAKSDADLLIVQTAIAAAASQPNKTTVVVTEDTDILVLLCFHTETRPA